MSLSIHFTRFPLSHSPILVSPFAFINVPLPLCFPSTHLPMYFLPSLQINVPCPCFLSSKYLYRWKFLLSFVYSSVRPLCQTITMHLISVPISLVLPLVRPHIESYLSQPAPYLFRECRYCRNHHHKTNRPRTPGVPFRVCARPHIVPYILSRRARFPPLDRVVYHLASRRSRSNRCYGSTCPFRWPYR